MNSKRILSMIGAAAVAASVALTSLPVCAAVTTMSDGGQFDAAYYAATYPDVAAALGTDANTLYQHYKTFGIKEGRQPYAAGTAATAATATPAATQTTKAVTLNARQKAILKEVLHWYLYESGGWSYCDPFDPALADYEGYKFIPYKSVKNPVYAVADLDSDGVVEVYTYGGYGWTMYLLDDTKDVNAYGLNIYGYIPGQDLYYTEDNWGAAIEGLIDGYSMFGVMDYAYTDRTKQTVMVEDADYNKVGTITAADLAAIKATFTPIEQLVQVQPLTKANYKAIK